MSTRLMQLSPRQVSMIRWALKEQARRYRRMYGGRKYAGEAFAEIRASARKEASAYEDLASRMHGKITIEETA